MPPTTQERAQFRIARRRSPGSAMVTKHGGAAVASWGEGACRLAETRGDFLNRRHRASLIAAPSVIPVPTQRTAVNGQPLQAVLVCCVDVRRIDFKKISKGNAGECKDVTTFVDDVASCDVSEPKAKTRRGGVRCPASYRETFSPYVKSCNVFPRKFTVVGTAWT